MSTSAPKQPTDHQAKKREGVKFKAMIPGKPDEHGKPTTPVARTFTLAPVDEAVVEKVPARYTYDVTMNPDSEEAQIRLAFAYLDAMDKPSVRDALLSLTTGEMMSVLRRWFVGESEGSSE